MRFVAALARALLASSLLITRVGWGQMEHEPNDPCPSAQSFGVIPLPFELNGNLDSSLEPDVDFYRVRAAPGARLSIELQGESSGSGTLYNPYLGVFDSNCILRASNDNDGYGLDARLEFTVPPNATLVLGVTECCDSGFLGGGEGTYRLSVDISTSIASISGRLVDADTGQGIPSYPQDGYASLRLCNDADCSSAEEVAQAYTDDDGRFVFTEDYYGESLKAGRYEIFATARPYESLTVGPFDVAVGQAYDLGDVALTPLPTVQSISGRVIDAITGEPLDGSFNYNYVSLSFCTDYCDTVDSTDVQADGTFVFTHDYSGVPLIAGPYQIYVSADDYYSVTTEIFDVPAEAAYDVGDIAIQAQTVGFSDYEPCRIPREGGACEFSVTVANRLSNSLVGGKAWIIVDGSSIGSVLEYTTFQLPHVANVALESGESKVLHFSFWVPGTVDNDASLCVRAYAGEAMPNAFFGTVGQRDLFCIRKGDLGDFIVMPPQEARAHFDRIHGRGVLVRPRAVPPRK